MIPAALGSTAEGLICIAVEMMISKATTSSCLCWEPGFPALEARLPLGSHLWEFLHLGVLPVARRGHLLGAGVFLTEQNLLLYPGLVHAGACVVGTTFGGTAGFCGTQLSCRAGCCELCCRAGPSAGARAQKSLEGCGDYAEDSF